MNENEFGAKMKSWLDRSAAGVGDVQATRLKAARLRAMDAFREPVGFGGVAVGARTAQLLRYAFTPRALLALPVIALVAFLAIQSTTAEPDLGELDAQLLTQELPPDAFLDPDFRAWLGKSQG